MLRHRLNLVAWPETWFIETDEGTFEYTGGLGEVVALCDLLGDGFISACRIR